MDGLKKLVDGIFSLQVIDTTEASATYDNGSVTGSWSVMAGIANSLLILFVLWAGYVTMYAGSFGGRSYQAARELLPRVFLGAIAINISGWFAKTLIDFNDALCAIPGHDLSTFTNLWPGGDPDLGKLLFALAFVIAAVLLIVQEFVRLALIDLLIITAPLGLLCWIAPETQGWARLWSNTLVTVVIVQFLQLVVLALGASLMSYGGGMQAFGGLMSLLVGVATLYAAFKVPALLRSIGGGTPRRRRASWAMSWDLRAACSCSIACSRSCKRRARLEMDAAWGWLLGGVGSLVLALGLLLVVVLAPPTAMALNGSDTGTGGTGGGSGTVTATGSVAQSALAMARSLYQCRAPGDPAGYTWDKCYTSNMPQEALDYWASVCPYGSGCWPYWQNGNLQCVELVTAAYAMAGNPLPRSGNAIAFWSLYRGLSGWAEIPVALSWGNGAPRGLPQPGDMLIWYNAGEPTLGHIAIALQVQDPSAGAPGSVTFAQANGPAALQSLAIAPDFSVTNSGSMTLVGYIRYVG